MIKPKNVVFAEATNKVIEGVETAYRAVSSTLGPYASTVVLENENGKDKAPVVTKDGVSVARCVSLKDPLQQLGARLVLQASSQADAKSGDGTTTTLILAYEAMKMARHAIENGMLMHQVRKQLEESRDYIANALLTAATNFENNDEVKKFVALVSANGEERLAQIAVDAVRRARGGEVRKYMSRSEHDTIEVKTGAVISGKPLTVDAIPRRDDSFEIVKPNVMLANGEVDGKRIDSIIKQIKQEGYSDYVVLFCEDIRDDVDMKVAAFNDLNNQGVLLIVLPTPGVGDFRQQFLAVMELMTGAEINELGTEHFELGKCESIIIERQNITINPKPAFYVSGADEAECARITAMQNEFPIGTSRYNRFNELLRFVVGRRVSVHVGGLSEADCKERFDRLVDAVNAIVRAESGVIVGGGTTLAALSARVQNQFPQLVGLDKVLRAPMAKIYENAGIENASEIVEECLNHPLRTHLHNDTYIPFFDLDEQLHVDLYAVEKPILDPVLVTYNAVRAAFSLASTIVTTRCYIVDADQN